MPRHRRGYGVVLLAATATLCVVAALVISATGSWHDDDASAVAVLHGPEQRDVAAVAVFRGTPAAPSGAADAAPDPAATGAYPLCTYPPHRDCVVDGDTFYFGTEPIRIADIDAPETNEPGCAREADIGAQATRRLAALLGDGPFTLQAPGAAEIDQYGRHLRTVLRNGRSIGAMLVVEGLAEPWQGPSTRWCG